MVHNNYRSAIWRDDPYEDWEYTLQKKVDGKWTTIDEGEGGRIESQLMDEIDLYVKNNPI
jgi:hypothetical protein